MIGPSRISGTIAKMPATSRNRREPVNRVMEVVVSRASARHMSAASTPQTTAAASAAASKRQARNCEPRSSRVSRPGMPMKPESSSPAASFGREIVKVVKRAGSRVRSTPKATSGMSAQPSVMAETASTRYMRMSAVSRVAAKTSAATSATIRPRP